MIRPRKMFLGPILAALAAAAPARSEYIYSSDYSIKFQPAVFSLQNAPMGRQIDVTVGWRLDGKTPKQNFVTHIQLTDEMGRSVFSSSAPHAPPTSQWQSGQTAPQKFSVTIPKDRPDKLTKPVKSAHIFEGWHWLLVSLETPKDAKPAGVQILDNPKAQPFASLCRRYALGRLYVSSSSVAITALDFADVALWKPQPVRLAMVNEASEPIDVGYRIVVEDESRAVLFEHLANAHLEPGAAAEWKKDLAFDTVGALVARVEIYEGRRLRTQAERRFTVTPPKGLAAAVSRGNKVHIDGLSMHTPIRVQLKSPDGAPIRTTRSCVRYSHASHRPLIVELTHDQPQVSYRLRPMPAWGYYDVRVTADVGGRKFSVAKRLVAAVFSTASKNILCNGEPWICKSVNVHGIFASRSLTEKALQILVDLGFNSVRGDHPVAWQRELAVDYNIGWINLPYFSCIHTDKLYPQLGEDPLATMREISRQACLNCADDAGTILWNSANEIEGQLDEVLANLYPVYKVYDPYQRPVLYANLFGQDRWVDQDIMAINYYFAPHQSATKKQPVIRRSVEIGLKHDMPVIYTEFNSWWGPVSESGVMAYRDMFQFGLDIGMSGGTLYKLTDVIDRHPGVVSSGPQLHIRTEMATAAKRYHADAELVLVSRAGRSCRIDVRNKRPFTLRNVSIRLIARGQELARQKSDRIAPGESFPIDLTLPPEWKDQPIFVQGKIDFVTHHAFPCSVEDVLPVGTTDSAKP